MTTKTKKAPESIKLSGRMGDKLGLECKYDGARFHVWVDKKTLKPEDGAVLYKNPTLEVKYRGPGYFSTRQLELTGEIGRTILPAMLEAAPKLLPALLAGEELDLAHAEANIEERWREEAIKEAGRALLKAALEAVAEAHDSPTILAEAALGMIVLKLKPAIAAAKDWKAYRAAKQQGDL